VPISTQRPDENKNLTDTVHYSEFRVEGGDINDKRQNAKSFEHAWKHDEEHEVSGSGRNGHLLNFRQLICIMRLLISVN
jgi:hypothetical protein